MADKPETKDLFPTSLEQNPSLVQTDSQDRFQQLQDQVDSIKTVMEENFKVMQDLREKLGNERGVMRDTMRVLREKMDEDIMKFLDENQREDYKRIQEERRAMMRERRRPQNPPDNEGN